MKLKRNLFICSSALLGLFISANINNGHVKAAEMNNSNADTTSSQKSQVATQQPNAPLTLNKETVQENTQPQKEETKQTTKVVIHYQGDGDNWKPYVWPNGKGGQQYEWSGKDDNGYYADINLDGDNDSVGILIKGKDNWNKDGSGSDRHQNVSDNGKAEVYYKQGDDANQKVTPKYSQSKINVHYLGDDASTLDYWTDTDTTKKSISLKKNLEQNEFDGAFEIDNSSFGKIFVQPNNGVETSFTPIADKTTTEIYLVPKDKEAYYTKSFAEQSTKDVIDSAQVPDLHTIDIKTSKKMTADKAKEKISLSDGNSIKDIKAINPDGDGLSKDFVITTTNDIDITKENRIAINGHMTAFDIGRYVRSDDFDNKYYYDGNDLGATYTEQDTKIKLWAPTANTVTLRLYNSVNNDAAPTKEIILTRGEKGTWFTNLSGNYKGWAYDYQLKFGDGTTNISNDPYSTAVTINGKRSVIEDVNNIKPSDFNRMPSFSKPTDAIIYETSVRDFTSDPNSGIKDKGKFLGLIESGKTPDGFVTGLDYLKSLGITHVQLMPSADFASVDETKDLANQYNWGYDPQNYNVPEGSYSTDPANPTSRIMEMKEMINGLHKAGIRVVMDVVYNHVYNTQQQAFNLTVPGYYFRYNDNNQMTSDSGCGDDVATTRKMVRKYIVDSVKYWATNYKVDGFRFDIMSLLDTETMNEVRSALDQIDPGIITYGEGWDMNGYTKTIGTSQPNAQKVPGIGFFSDDMRNSVKGDDNGSWGLVLGDGHELSYNTDLTRFWDSMFGGQWLGKDAWEPHPYVKPSQVINYVACHDGHTLYDYLKSQLPNASKEELAKRINLANSMVMFAEGVPLYHSGQEAMRSKQGNGNSYNSPIGINEIKWNEVAENNSTVDYFKKLAKLRAQLPVLRLNDYSEINKEMKGLSNGDTVHGVFAFEYNVDGKKLAILFNVNNSKVDFNLADFSKGKKLLDSDGNVQLSKVTELAPLSTLVVDESGTIKLPDDHKKVDKDNVPDGYKASDFTKDITRTITVTKPDGLTVDKSQTITLSRTGIYNEITKELTFNDWNLGKFDKVTDIPVIDGYTPSKSSIDEEDNIGINYQDPKIEIQYTANPQHVNIKYVGKDGEQIFAQQITGHTDEKVNVQSEIPDGWKLSAGQNIPSSVTLKAKDNHDIVVTIEHGVTEVTPDAPQKKDSIIPGTKDKRFPAGLESTDLNKKLTRTITVVDPHTGEHKVIQTLEFGRKAILDNVTGKVAYGSWIPKSGFNSSFEEFAVPEVKGYTPNQAKIEAKTLSDEEIDNWVDPQSKITYTAGSHTMTYTFVDADNGDKIGQPIQIKGNTDETKEVALSIPAGYELADNNKQLPNQYKFGDSDGSAIIELKKIKDDTSKDHTDKPENPGDKTHDNPSDKPANPGDKDHNVPSDKPANPDIPRIPDYTETSASSDSENAKNDVTENSQIQKDNTTIEDNDNLDQIVLPLRKNAYIYRSNGKKAKKHGRNILYRASRKVTIYDNGRIYLIKGNHFYRIGKNSYIKVQNFSKKIRLYRNSYVYDHNGKITKKRIVLKKGKYLAVYGEVTIHGKKYYRLGKDQFIKVSNTVNR